MAFPVTMHDVRRSVRELELNDTVLCVHSSLRSFGRVEGGADTIIDALLGHGCTVMVPTFSWDTHLVTPPLGMRPERNGWDYAHAPQAPGRPDRIYSPDSNVIDKGMGLLPRTLLGRADRERGDHPLSSFAAVGPRARRLVGGQRPLDVYAPLRTIASLDGIVVLMGVGLDRMTLLHLAERRAGRVIFRRWASDQNGRAAMVEGGGCSEGFGNLEPHIHSLQRRTAVGGSSWRAFPARSTLNVAAHAIRRNPRITHCGEECARCDDAVAGGPIL